VRLVVDTGVFSASLSRRRRARLETQVGRMVGNQVFLAAVTVSELRYGALVAQWGELRRQRLEQSIQAATVIPVSDALLRT
jgi:predicted nucleic acid-binding protein